MSEQEIYIEAQNRRDPAERRRFLDEACAGNKVLRERVELLIREFDQLGSFLESSPQTLGATADISVTAETLGTQIGPYKLLQQIGEGGMGVVYMAEQTEPVKRRVALKIIKPGMDSRQVIARFEAERQALSLMDHPNIAKVFDAGTTESGRPYFVMELVKGQPITQYCDEHHFTPRQRLELLLPVCHAIQHAHQKGIIHRDIKPTNILVAEYDNQPVPKVIDFGVAKAISQTLTEKTMFTGLGQIVGTLEYMSPEQAKVNQLDIDTRSDIYSLGVLMYELLTGSTPLDKVRLRSAGWDEMLRIIREEEPQKPSTKLSSSETLPSVAANRSMEPARLSRTIRGELDWIVMKALEKDRNRRYETANGFAQDLQRYLTDEPVQACPPSAAYRFRKFARRNKAALVTTSIIVVATLLAVGSFGWAVRDRAAREAEIAHERDNREAELKRERESRLAKAAGQVESIFAEVDALEGEQKWPEALAAARRAEAIVNGGEVDAATAERVRERLRGLAFIERLEQIRMQRAIWVEGQIDNAGADQGYARAFREYGVDLDELAVETSIDRLKARPALAIPLAAALDNWTDARLKLSVKDADALRRLVAVARGIDPEPLRDRLRSTRGNAASEVGDELRRLADSIDIRMQHPATVVIFAARLRQAKHEDAALRLLRDVQLVHSGDFWINFELASELRQQSDDDGAVRFYTAAVALRPTAFAAVSNLGWVLKAQGKLDEAVAAFRKAIELAPKLPGAFASFGEALSDQNKLDEAITAYRRAIELDPKYVRAYHDLGNALLRQKKLPEAVAAYRKAIELDPKYAVAHIGLGAALREQEKLDEAIAAYRTVIELYPKYALAHSNLGALLCDELKEYDQAIECFRKAIELDPKVALSYNNLGIALRHQEKLDEAIAAHRKAIELDPKFAWAYNSLGNALHSQKKLEEAVAAYRKAIELDPKFVKAYISLGALLCDELKAYDQAIECFLKALEIDPNNAGARHNLGAARGAASKKAWDLTYSPDPKIRDSKRAIEAVKEAIELAPQLSQSWQCLGWIEYRAGNWRASIEALEKSCKLQVGGTGDAGQWIVLALAHAKLAAQEDLPDKARALHKAEAGRWYDQAEKAIDGQWRVRPSDVLGQAIWDYREETRELMGVKETKK